jgi:hypothetical protein
MNKQINYQKLWEVADECLNDLYSIHPKELLENIPKIIKKKFKEYSKERNQIISNNKH